MKQKPIVGIVGCHREFESETAHLVKARYVAGVRDFADAVPVIVPGFSDQEDADLLVAHLDGILLTGATSNIGRHPDGSVENEHGPFDEIRDETSFALIEAARRLQVPLFGICRGLQEINVALGGTIIDQRDSAKVEVAHHAPEGVGLEEMFGQKHEINVSPGSRLAQITQNSRVEVNSVHFQMIDRLGDGLRVEATADDGVIEAIAARDGSELFAVQWHPEWRPNERSHHLQFWSAFGHATRLHLARRIGKSV